MALALGVLALSTLIAFPSSASAEGPRSSGSQFEYRRAVNTFPAVPGDTMGTGFPDGKARRWVSKVWLTPSGAGQSEIREVAGPTTDKTRDEYSCNLPELLLTYAHSGGPACTLYRTRMTLYDTRLVSDPPGFQPPKYSASGHAVDDLAGRQEVEKAVNRQTGYLFRLQSAGPRAGARLQALVNLLANPLATEQTRGIAVSLLRELSGSTFAANAIDPSGRPSSMVALPDRSHTGVVDLNGNTFDLTDSVEMTQEVYFDPLTFDLRATRTLLDSTQLASVAPWLSSDGAPAVIAQSVYDPVESVRDKRLRQVLRPCRKLGRDQEGLCIDIGYRGGPR